MATGLLAGQRVRRLYRADGKAWVQPDDSPGLILERDGNMVLVQWSSGRREWLRSMDATIGEADTKKMFAERGPAMEAVGVNRFRSAVRDARHAMGPSKVEQVVWMERVQTALEVLAERDA